MVPVLEKNNNKIDPILSKNLGIFCSLFLREVKNLIIADNSDQSKNEI